MTLIFIFMLCIVAVLMVIIKHYIDDIEDFLHDNNELLSEIFYVLSEEEKDNVISEIDWCDTDTRIELVRDLGLRCSEPLKEECKTCPAVEWCDTGKELIND